MTKKEQELLGLMHIYAMFNWKKVELECILEQIEAVISGLA